MSSLIYIPSYSIRIRQKLSVYWVEICAICPIHGSKCRAQNTLVRMRDCFPSLRIYKHTQCTMLVHRPFPTMRKVISPDEFATKMQIDMPLIFSGAAGQDNLTAYTRRTYAQLNHILRHNNYAVVAAMAQSVADTINSCIHTRIQLICREFETESDYDVLHSRLKQLRVDTGYLRGNMRMLFENDIYRTKPGFHQEFFRNPHTTILTTVVHECKVQLVPVIQNRLYNEFQRHHDIVATANELKQLVEKFDTVGVFHDLYRQPTPPAMGPAAAKACAFRLLPQLENAYMAFVQCMIMSQHQSNHTAAPNILRYVMAHQDICTLTPMLDDKIEAIKYCHTLAYAGTDGDVPALLPDCPRFFRPV